MPLAYCVGGCLRNAGRKTGVSCSQTPIQIPGSRAEYSDEAKSIRLETDVKTEQLLDEIREANMTYLILAQNMIRLDKPQAMYRLGVTEEVADVLEQLSTGQLLKIASSNMLVCSFRFDDKVVWNLLTSHSKDRSVAGVHAAILMSSPLAQAA